MESSASVELVEKSSEEVENIKESVLLARSVYERAYKELKSQGNYTLCSLSFELKE